MNSGAVITTVIGGSLVCFALVQARRIRNLRRTGVTVVGTVVGYERTVDDGALYAPMITFVDERGTRRQFTVAARSSWLLHDVGEEVAVIYPLGRPSDPRLTSRAHLLMEIGLPLAVGAMFAMFGLLGLRQG
ncbi:DUF3592 domain-containing protein [Micromonospora orduensis]|uniref:DUF3592 domain-containing protein n=1 Tax=Micromonospora orduensis TaxID=1420891 RepID=UPI0033DE0E4F